MPPLQILALALALAASSLPAAPAGASIPENAFAHAYSDVRPDPDIRFGVLANGFRYLLMRNGTPPGQTALRLRIGSGSLEEADEQRGLAHFLEHMAFKGSANVPSGEMIKLLERKGLAFGPDTNARTGFTETVFMLDLPRSDAESLDLGLMLMRETAGSLALSQGAMDQERGVVLSEERLRDTPDFEAMKKRLRFLLPGQLAPERLAIGDVGVLKAARASSLRSYYEANYRPDRATLVVVGDVDPAAIEAKIRRRFSDWRPAGAETENPRLGALASRSSEAQLLVQPGAHDALSIAWTRPYAARFESEAKDRGELIEDLAAGVVSRRLERLSKSRDPPFIGAALSVSDQVRSARVTSLGASPRPGGWRAALTAALATARQAAAFGTTPSEVEEEIGELRARFETLAAGAATRRSPDLASEYVRALDAREVPTSPRQDLERFERNVRSLKPGEVDAALKSLFSGSGPIVTLVSHEPIDGGEGALKAAFDLARTQGVDRSVSSAKVAWPYVDFGVPGRVVGRGEAEDLKVSFLTFANGVRLNVKPTPFRKDEILVKVKIGRGRLDLPKDRKTQLWAAPALTLGGLKRIGLDDMDRALSSRIYGDAVGLADDALVLSGATRRSDLELQLQLLAAYLSDPAFRPEGFERGREALLAQLDQLNATPQGVFTREASFLDHGRDLRWAPPTKAEVTRATLEDLKAELVPILASGPVEVDIVGDVEVDAAAAAVAKTFGALQRPSPGAPQQDGLPTAPTPNTGAPPVDLHHLGRGDQAIAYAAWPTLGLFADPQSVRAVNLAADVLQLRLVDEVRIKQGATYSPAVSSSPSDVFVNYGLVNASVEIPPPLIPGFYGSLSSLSRDLALNGPTPDEFARALRPRVETLKRAQQTNEYWLTWISGADRDPRRLDVVRDTLAGYARLTPLDVKAAAARYFTDANAFRIEVTPGAAAASGE